MKIGKVVEILRTVSRVVDEEWNKLTPEQRRKICDNIMERAAKRAAQRKEDMEGSEVKS